MKHLSLICAVQLPLASWAGLDAGIAAYTVADYAEALVEFQALADQGDMQGQYFVGFFYHNGFGVKTSQVEAVKWFSKAAEQGDPRSQYYVGIIYATGKGIAKDLPKADLWLTLSATNPKTSYRDSLYTKEEIAKIEKKMTPEQIAEVKDLVGKWKPQAQN